MFFLNITKGKALAAVGFLSILAVVFLYISGGIIYLSDRYMNRIKSDETDAAFREFLSSYGLVALPGEPVKEQVKIPYLFNRSYKEYERIQNEMGLSLNEFKGKTVTRYTYGIENKSDGKAYYANILYYKGYIIGGDVNCPDLEEGFVKSFLDI